MYWAQSQIRRRDFLKIIAAQPRRFRDRLAQAIALGNRIGSTDARSTGMELVSFADINWQHAVRKLPELL
jgi:hypothetical protein